MWPIDWHELRRLFFRAPLIRALPLERPRTELTTTVFTGAPRPWLDYLKLRRRERYDRDLTLRVIWDGEARRLRFEPESGEDAGLLARCLEEAWGRAREKARRRPIAAATLDDLVFGNATNADSELLLRVSSSLPSEASREVLIDDSLRATRTDLVLAGRLVDPVLRDWRYASRDGDERLGVVWPMLRRIISRLGYASYPRDRFVDKIDLTVRTTTLDVNLLHEGVRGGRLVPDRAGERYRAFLARRDGLAEDDVDERQPYLRLLNRLSFALRKEDLEAYRHQHRILVREYLDERYLRLSLAGAMPEVPEEMEELPHRREGRRVLTPVPRTGRAGILDGDDLAAWRRVERPFRQRGLVLLRQLGIGEFGRVYEALNADNPSLPERVAIKVDRLGKDANAILDAERAAELGRYLARSPHVIRIHDVGRLTPDDVTYHVLQLVDGDTLDHLAEISGREHASVSRPDTPRSSEDRIREEYRRAMEGSGSQGWRRRRPARPFTHELSVSMGLDILTSVMLWLEEVHDLGYAINDLKNGNLMISRRGQLKGIDLDSYSRIRSAADRAPDFYFLSVSALMLMLSGGDAECTAATCDVFQVNPETLRADILECWPFGDVGRESQGRVETEEVVLFLVDLVRRCRNRDYAREPDAFRADVDRLIRLKRSIQLQEIVLD